MICNIDELRLQIRHGISGFKAEKIININGLDSRILTPDYNLYES